LGYRQPFAFIGVKGGAPGSANQCMDKTKILLRMEATASLATTKQQQKGTTAAAAAVVQSPAGSSSSSSSSDGSGAGAEAVAVAAVSGGVALGDFQVERTDVAELMLKED
jgi:hypothetical protein